MVEAAREAIPMVAYAYSEGIVNAEFIGRNLEAALTTYEQEKARG